MTTHDRVALITGGAQGIGKAIAARLLDDGWAALIADADEDAGQAAEEELRGEGACAFQPLDVGDAESVDRAVAEARQRFGGLNGLVNNAGVMAAAPPEELDAADWERVIRTNLTGAFLCARTAAKDLRVRRGAIVNIASTRALMSEPNSEAYAASKGGLVALTHALAMSLGAEIRVNAISPGWIDVSHWGSPADRRAPETLRPVDHAQHPVGRVGLPEDVAGLAAWLLGPESHFVTGQNFVVDGGMTKKMIYA